jgi:SPP1 family predicted phage head-tail adaptor
MDRRVQFLRGTLSDDGMSEDIRWTDTETDAHGNVLWAEKTDVSDTEKMRAQAAGSDLTARFVLRFSDFTNAIETTDRLHCEGKVFDITGIKEIGRRDRLEFSAVARRD